MTRLSADVARCPGVGSDADGWRDGCERCLRRTAPRPWPFVVGMTPPRVVEVVCEFLIENERQIYG